jgi:hypothetical protein
MSSQPDRDGPPPQSQPPPQGYPLDGYPYPPQGNPPPGYPYPPPANGYPQAPPGIVTLILEYYNSHIFYLRIYFFLLQSHYQICCANCEISKEFHDGFTHCFSFAIVRNTGYGQQQQQQGYYGQQPNYYQGGIMAPPQQGYYGQDPRQQSGGWLQGW